MSNETETTQPTCAQCDLEGIPPEKREVHHIRQNLDLANMLLKDYREGRFLGPRVITTREAELQADIDKLQAKLNAAEEKNRELRVAKAALADLRDWVARQVPDDVPNRHAVLARAEEGLRTSAVLKVEV